MLIFLSLAHTFSFLNRDVALTPYKAPTNNLSFMIGSAIIKNPKGRFMISQNSPENASIMVNGIELCADDTREIVPCKSSKERNYTWKVIIKENKGIVIKYAGKSSKNNDTCWTLVNDDKLIHMKSCFESRDQIFHPENFERLLPEAYDPKPLAISSPMQAFKVPFPRARGVKVKASDKKTLTNELNPCKNEFLTCPTSTLEKQIKFNIQNCTGKIVKCRPLKKGLPNLGAKATTSRKIISGRGIKDTVRKVVASETAKSILKLKKKVSFKSKENMTKKQSSSRIFRSSAKKESHPVRYARYVQSQPIISPIRPKFSSTRDESRLDKGLINNHYYNRQPMSFHSL